MFQLTEAMAYAEEDIRRRTDIDYDSQEDDLSESFEDAVEPVVLGEKRDRSQDDEDDGEDDDEVLVHAAPLQRRRLIRPLRAPVPAAQRMPVAGDQPVRPLRVQLGDQLMRIDNSEDDPNIVLPDEVHRAPLQRAGLVEIDLLAAQIIARGQDSQGQNYTVRKL